MTATDATPGPPLNPDQLRAQWIELEAMWTAATERALALPGDAVDERVDGEWSFAETVRHLIFATDAWLSRPVLGEVAPFWSAAMPHSSLANEVVEAHGIDRFAEPKWADTVDMRVQRQNAVREYLAGLAAPELDRVCDPTLLPPDFPAEVELTVGECLATIIEEEAAHLQYATRDLTVLEQRAAEQ